MTILNNDQLDHLIEWTAGEKERNERIRLELEAERLAKEAEEAKRAKFLADPANKERIEKEELSILRDKARDLLKTNEYHKEFYMLPKTIANNSLVVKEIDEINAAKEAAKPKTHPLVVVLIGICCIPFIVPLLFGCVIGLIAEPFMDKRQKFSYDEYYSICHTFLWNATREEFTLLIAELSPSIKP